MRYRGFCITSCPDKEVEKYNDRTHQVENCDGFFCQVFRGDDDLRMYPIDNFLLAVGHEIADTSDEERDRGIRENVDDLWMCYKESAAKLTVKSKNDLIGRLVSWLGESEDGEDLYDTLHHIGLTDEDIREIGFKSLVPYFDREAYAQTIADYLIDTGTENTTTGNWNIGFNDINQMYGINLPKDSEMLDAITNSLDRDILADLDLSDDSFDMVFYFNYCPQAELMDSFEQQM